MLPCYYPYFGFTAIVYNHLFVTAKCVVEVAVALTAAVITEAQNATG